MKKLHAVVVLLLLVLFTQISALELSGSLFMGTRTDTNCDYNIGYGFSQSDWIKFSGSLKRRNDDMKHRNYNLILSKEFVIREDTNFGINPRFQWENWDDPQINYTRFDFRFFYYKFYAGLCQVLDQPWKPEFEEFWNEKFTQQGIIGFKHKFHLDLIEDLPLTLFANVSYLTDDFDTFKEDHEFKLTADVSKIVSLWIQGRICEYSRYDLILKSGVSIKLFPNKK